MMKINKKIKAFMSIIMACFMCVGVLLSIKTDVYADSSKEYVYDNAGILTADEISKLKSQCKKASEDSECDIVIITTNIGHDGSTMDSYLKKFLDDNGHSQNAVIYGVDMKSRADRMYTQGKAGTDISQRDNSSEYHKRANFPENIEFSGISLYSDKSIRHHKNTRNFNGN